MEGDGPRLFPRAYATAPKSVARVVLIGFMAAGKSTVGRRLARLLGWRFVDFDDEIEHRTGMPIPDFFEEHGEAEFRSLEAELTGEFGGARGVVLAPGGGWITQPELVERLGPGSLLVWLVVSPEEVVRRAEKTLSHRPLLAGADDPLAKAAAMMREREPLYRLADIAIEVDGREADAIAREIAALIID